MTEQSSYTGGRTDFQHLLSIGFSEAEVVNLVYMKDHIIEQIEYREIVEECRRLHFLRWLVEHDRISR